MGVEIVFNNLAALADKMEAAAEDIVDETAERVLARAGVLVPVKTGELKDSLEKQTINRHEAHVVAGTDHALFPEYGTVNQAAQPYMTPAAEAERANFVKDFENLERRL